MTTTETNETEHSEHDHSGHSHGASRSGELEGVSDARLLWAVILNQLLTVGQVVAGIFSGSVAPPSDSVVVRREQPDTYHLSDEIPKTANRWSQVMGLVASTTLRAI